MKFPRLLKICLGSAVGLLALAGCETVVEVPLPAHTPRLALRAVLCNQVPDDALYTDFAFFQPFVSHSQSILEEVELKPVNNATLTITNASGQVVEKYQYGIIGPGNSGDGYYKPVSSFAGQPGQTYTLTAAAPGFETVSSALVMPSEVNGISGSFLKTQDNAYGFEGKVSLRFTDNALEDNYYLLFGILLDAQRSPILNSSFSEISNDDDLGTDLAEIRFSETRFQEFYPFDDKSRQGKTITLNRPVSIFADLQSSRQPRFLRLIVSTITPDTYRFLRSLQKYSDTNGNPFSEPVPVQGNLTNGYGYFGGFTHSFVDVALP